MENLHVVLNNFTHASRTLKQVRTIASLPGIDNVYVAALHKVKLKTKEKISEKIFLNRFKLRTRGLNKSLLFQVIKYIEFTFKILIFYRKKKIKIINVHSLSLLPLCYLFKLIYQTKLIYDPHELETESSNLQGFRKKLSKLIEFLLIKRVDHIFVVSENIADWYKKNYNIPRPTVVFNVPMASNKKNTNYLRNTLHLRKDQIIILYQGGLVAGRGINLLLEAFKKRTNDKVVIVFMGYGEFEKKIQSDSKLYNNIFFHEAVSPDMVLNYTASADVGIALIENTCLSYNFCMPNKLFEYAMCGLPVIVSNMIEMSNFVKTHQMGIIIKNDSVENVNFTIDKLLSLDLNKLKQNAKKAALANSWENQEKKMITIYQKFLKRA